MADENNNRTIAVKGSTKSGLDSLKASDFQPYDEIIRGLIADWRKRHGDKPVVLEEAGA
jgi:hypothetical protein